MLLRHENYYEIIRLSGVLHLGFFRGLKLTLKLEKC